MKNRQKLKTTNQNKYSILLIDVSKLYVIHHEKPTLVEHLINRKTEKFWALKNINLEIKQGEKVGIIGPNGSGKTTLLKIISGIASATTGRVITNGRIVSLIDLEAGFHPDLTGLQNIYLSGMLLGMRRKEINKKVKKIIEFADIGKFIDAPLFTYSSGMKLKLGFAVSVHASPDILILDEEINVGDIKFQIKIKKYIENVINSEKIFIIVSHWLEFVNKNCNRIIYVKSGKIVKDGRSEVISKYIQSH